MRSGRYKPEEIAHIADTYVDAGCNVAETCRRLRVEGEPYANLQDKRLYQWTHGNRHDFNTEVVRARERKGERDRRRAIQDPISALERLAGDINERHELMQRAQAEAITANSLNDTELARVESLLLKQEAQLVDVHRTLANLRNPREGEAAVQAVVAFVQVLINRASPRQREVIVQVVRPLLPEGRADVA